VVTTNERLFRLFNYFNVKLFFVVTCFLNLQGRKKAHRSHNSSASGRFNSVLELIGPKRVPAEEEVVAAPPSPSVVVDEG